MSHDFFQGSNQMKSEVMGYSVICLSVGFHHRVRKPSKRKSKYPKYIKGYLETIVKDKL